jgi:hypothetical protein
VKQGEKECSVCRLPTTRTDGLCSPCRMGSVASEHVPRSGDVQAEKSMNSASSEQWLDYEKALQCGHDEERTAIVGWLLTLDEQDPNEWYAPRHIAEKIRERAYMTPEQGRRPNEARVPGIDGTEVRPFAFDVPRRDTSDDPPSRPDEPRPGGGSRYCHPTPPCTCRVEGSVSIYDRECPRHSVRRSSDAQVPPPGKCWICGRPVGNAAIGGKLTPSGKFECNDAQTGSCPRSETAIPEDAMSDGSSAAIRGRAGEVTVGDVAQDGTGPWKLFLGEYGVAQWPSEPSNEEPEKYAREVARVVREALADEEYGPVRRRPTATAPEVVDIEAVARAIYLATDPKRAWSSDASWDSDSEVTLCEWERDEYRDMARAAVGAMPEGPVRERATNLASKVLAVDGAGPSEEEWSAIVRLAKDGAP